MSAIGVNALYLLPGVVGGTEIYLRELLKALARIDAANEYFVFTNRETGPDLVPAQPNFHWAPQPVRATFRPGRLLWEQTMLPAKAARLDVLLNAGFTAPLVCPCPQVSVFHDLQHKRYPQYFSATDLPFWNLFLWIAACRSDRLIAVSAATRDDLTRYYGTGPQAVHIVPHGVDARFFDLDRGRTEPFLLCVSAHRPHKNLDRLIRAFVRSGVEERLVIAGTTGPETARLHALTAELKAEGRVCLTGWIGRDELFGLYARARAVVFPSLFEGFGMPVLEAMAAGIPVACSDIPPLREVAEESALLFDALKDDDIASAVQRIASDEPLRARLSAIGPVRARPYTWERTARATLAALLQAQA
jgi:glycosyltransferase involved in cell wall biosynthesis